MKKKAASFILVATVAGFFACDEATAPPTGGTRKPDSTFGAVFVHPVDCQNAGDNRLFVVEQAGRIIVVDTSGAVEPGVYLDITGSVASGGELGLLGLAFHPDYAVNGYFFVCYTTGPAGARKSRVSRFQVSGDPNAADPASERILLEVDQPADNHNGGALAFDGNGHLLVALGDGGGGGDPWGSGQDRATLLGSILRLDVGQNVDTPPYHGIPGDNPFVRNTSGWREEIFAYGLRNPWRISYDAQSDTIWTGDVGQGLWEEVDVIEKGKNYGWDCREGAHPYAGPPGAPSPACTLAVSAYTDPVWEYSHSVGRSITGGHVYRGTRIPSLVGKYVFADYVTGDVWALSHDGVSAGVEKLLTTGFRVSSFGLGADGEIYVVEYSPAAGVYRLDQIPGASP